jgi:hypothetical protein
MTGSLRNVFIYKKDLHMMQRFFDVMQFLCITIFYVPYNLQISRHQITCVTLYDMHYNSIMMIYFFQIEIICFA